MNRTEQELLDQVLRGKMSRKQLLRRAAAAGVSFGALGTLLSACGGGDDGSSATANVAPSDPSSVSPEWAELVEAAQAEGELRLSTIVGDGYANIGKSFGEKFGIDVKLDQARASDLAEKLRSERNAGQYRTDAWLQTWSVMHSELLPGGILLPVKPELIHPDVIDGSKWVGGEIRWMDAEGEFLPATGRLPAPIFSVNEREVPPDEEPKVLEDLLADRFRGKLAMAIPGQSGDDYLQWLYETGHEDFLRDLAATKPTQVSDLSKAFRDLARGTFAVVLGGTEPRIAPVVEEGLPVKPVAFMDQVQPTGGLATFNASTPALIDKAPNPNAAKLFVNWVMTKEGQTLLATGGGLESLRTDVPNDHLRPHQETDQQAFENDRYTLQDLELIEKLPEIREVLIGDIFRSA